MPSDTRTLTVELGERSYPIHIGPDLIDRAELYSPHVHGRQVMVVSNETVAPLYLGRVTKALSAFDVAHCILPDGEQFKTLQVLDTVYTALLEHRFDRRCTLVALGGGVIGDMTGFAAASYQRGVNFIQVPTTLLSQVDSSVGGKTGVNHALGKNMIGAFHQPQCVIADTTSLNTLPDRELSAGLAEVIKYGLIDDAAFLDWLEDAMPRLCARDPEALSHAIERSCADKAAIVAADEREAGRRALLNLGHTFGHAIETGMGYGAWLHGEAVAAGTCMAASMSAELGWISAAAVERVRRLVAAAGLPTDPPAELPGDRFRELMAVDKKVMDGRLRLVLLRALGEAVISSDFDADALARTLDAG
jgi:3-dehydroquinate synthase